MLAKLLVVIIFLGIVASLGSGMLFLVKDKGNSQRAVKALSVRIGISVALFGLLFVVGWAGVIEPHGVKP